MELKSSSGIILFILAVGISFALFYPNITGVVFSEQFEPVAEVSEPIFEGGGYELYLSEIKKVDDTTWEMEIQGKITGWMRFIDRTFNVEAQVWNCPNEQYSLVYKSANRIKSNGLFTIKASFTTPSSGKLRILFHNSGSTIDSGYNLKTGSLIRGWDSNLLRGIREVNVCSY